MIEKMSVELVDHMGSDLTVVNAARVSHNKHVDELEDKDEKLIGYLAKNGHWTPFGHAMITLRETVPIFVARQRFKHTVGFCYNEVSRRYVKDEPTFYLPDAWRATAKNIKQGSSQTNFIESMRSAMRENGQSNEDFLVSSKVDWIYNTSLDIYNEMLDAGVCAEQARMILPQGMMTSYYVTGSLAAWARAYHLRIEATAQKEIRDLAAMWNDNISPIFPKSWDALTLEENNDGTN
tara:strand:- start:54 stop:761 length:708 start_codon:yes stop_codon:yes gene_type:complete